MSQGKLVVVLVVQHVEQVAIKRMNVFYLGEVLQNVSDLFIQCLLTKLYLSHVKRSYSTDCIAWVDDGRCFSLCL